MANKRISIQDPDLAKVEVALKRAAVNARQLGIETNTPVYVFRDGKIIDILAEQRGTRSSKKLNANGSRATKLRLRQNSSNNKAK